MNAPTNRLEDRPRPLARAADTAVKVVGTLSALVTALAGAGIAVLTTEQADAVTACSVPFRAS